MRVVVREEDKFEKMRWQLLEERGPLSTLREYSVSNSKTFFVLSDKGIQYWGSLFTRKEKSFKEKFFSSRKFRFPVWQNCLLLRCKFALMFDRCGFNHAWLTHIRWKIFTVLNFFSQINSVVGKNICKIYNVMLSDKPWIKRKVKEPKGRKSKSALHFLSFSAKFNFPIWFQHSQCSWFHY